MSGYAVIPTIRVTDMTEALDFYGNVLEFKLERGGPNEVNSSIIRGNAQMMIEVPTDLYGEVYNAAIAKRMGSTSPMALYIEVPDLKDFYHRLIHEDVKIVDPLAERPWGQAEFTIEDLAGNWLTFWTAPAPEE
jgi:uncharacterized glyoxalase superfamily protein PhnB